MMPPSVSANAIYSRKLARVDESIQKCLQVPRYIKKNAAIMVYKYVSSCISFSIMKFNVDGTFTLI